MSTVSENIRYLRKLKGYTQQQFAERIGIKRSLLGAYEEARANPNQIYLGTMAEVLGVPVDHLLHKDLREVGQSFGAIRRLNPEHELPQESSAPSQTSTSKVPEKEAATPVVSANSSAPSGSSDIMDLFSQFMAGRSGMKLFRSVDDIPVAGISVVGEKLDDIEAVRDNELYLIETLDGRLFFRRVFNQLRIKGTLILSSDFLDKPILEISRRELKSVYRYLASIQTTAPSAAVPVHRLKELNDEIGRLLSGGL